MKENTVRNYAILFLFIIAAYLSDVKVLFYGAIAAALIGLIYRLGYMLYIKVFQNN